MRVHLNFVEQLPYILTVLCLGGLFLPKIAMYLSFINAGARIIYTFMYVKLGSDARRIGAFAGNLPVNLLALASLVYAVIEVAQ